MSSNDLDVEDATLHLVIQVQLEDLQGLKRTMAKGKRREGETPDSRVAIETYELEIWRQAQVIFDRSLCKRIARANRLDGQVINALVAQEDQSRRDMERDLRILGAPRRAKPEVEDYPVSAGLPEVYVSADADDQDYDDFDDILDQPESSAWAASRVSKRPADKPVLQAYELLFDEPPAAQAVKTKEKTQEKTQEKTKEKTQEKTKEKTKESTQCNSCFKKQPSSKVASCPCSHEYCTDCLRSLFTAAIADESLFPPKCCDKPIPVDDDDDDRHFLTPKLMSEFHAKEIEFSTPNRTYCHRPVCSTFVPKWSIEHDVATCPKCNEKTCVMCKGASHGVAEDCKQDEATKLLLELAAKNHWQRCYSCGRVVELEQGCFHMLSLSLPR
ncbi:IBR finger domain-containing protein [Colletotrichum musicola]|uniref:RBR-type E3 ubiquitin transferase n=1 Tax=Colletotrichum musicola TaxID=2175873 RepID=A0A8H6J9Z0_9PEZI|nr:IBR finger domain-containing protein [Colletotrichum musicola]